jgi:hypothetical protein
MSWMTNALREVAGLFVDDGWLAAAILGVIAVAAAISRLPGASLAAGGVLLVGSLAVLAANVLKAAWRD